MLSVYSPKASTNDMSLHTVILGLVKNKHLK